MEEKRGLLERLAAGEHIICAEGYLMALSRTGYLSQDHFVPEFLLDTPQVLRPIHYEFVHAGTDVIQALQFNTHCEKMRQIGREEDVEKINRIALKMAREVANQTGKLMAGGLCSTGLYRTQNRDADAKIRAMFEEQVRWSKEEGADYVIAETIPSLGEAELALEVILSFQLPAVITLCIRGTSNFKTMDDIPIARACQTLLDKGATLVGSNCYRGPDTMIKVVQEIVKEVAPEKVCALPVMYRTTDKQPTLFDLEDKDYPSNHPVYPDGLDAFYISTREVAQFTRQCKDLGLKYMGLCCGNMGNYTRAMAHALGRKPPAMKYLKENYKFIHPVKRMALLEKGEL